MKKKQKVTGYDKYVDWKIFSIPVVLFFVVLLIPTPYGMKDVGMEYTVASDVVIEHFTKTLFGKSASDAAQWEIGSRPYDGAEHANRCFESGSVS